MSSILDYFDMKSRREPRPAQVKILLQVEREWDNYDVFCIRAPTGSGKTLLADCIAAWRAGEKNNRCAILVPDNMLLEQMQQECNPRAQVLFAQRFYECTWKGLDDKPVRGNRGNCPGNDKAAPCKYRFTARCPYFRAVTNWKNSKVKVSNYWMTQAHKQQSKLDVVLVDEFHKLSGMLASLSSKQLWWHDFQYPIEAKSFGEIRQWCTRELGKFVQPPSRKDDPDGYNRWKNLHMLNQEITQDVGKVVITNTVATFRGHLEPCLEIRPLEVRDALPLVIDRKVTKKLVGLSATVSKWDIIDLGLGADRVLYLDCDSPIPVDRRPVYVRPCVSNRPTEGFRDLQQLVQIIGEAANKFNNDKGIVLVTYGLARALETAVIPHELRRRLMFFTSMTKRKVLAEFMESTEPSILVGAGITEGLDLKDDLARFAILAKIAWPSLEDVATARKCEEDPEWFAYQAARQVMQASGRVCRGPTDFGATYIVDSSFSRIPKDMFLKWFTDAWI